MTIPSNFQRASWAANAIKTFCDDTGNLSDDEAVHDLICDLGHYCRLQELDFLRLAANAISTWRAELRDPDGFRLDPGPNVKIVIEGASKPSQSRQKRRRQSKRRAGTRGAR